MVERMTAAEYKARGSKVPKKPKYGNKKTVVDGITFDSIAESKRYVTLRKMEADGEISHLAWQVKYPMRINGIHIGNYTADFAYFQDNERVVEDVKGVETREFRRTKKLIKALYGIDIKVVK